MAGLLQKVLKVRNVAGFSEWRPLTFFKVTREIRWQVSPIIHKTPSASPLDLLPKRLWCPVLPTNCRRFFRTGFRWGYQGSSVILNGNIATFSLLI